MTQDQYNRMRDLQAMDCDTYALPLNTDERAELAVLQLIERLSLKHSYAWTE